MYRPPVTEGTPNWPWLVITVGQTLTSFASSQGTFERSHIYIRLTKEMSTMEGTNPLESYTEFYFEIGLKYKYIKPVLFQKPQFPYKCKTSEENTSALQCKVYSAQMDLTEG